MVVAVDADRRMGIDGRTIIGMAIGTIVGMARVAGRAVCMGAVVTAVSADVNSNLDAAAMASMMVILG